MTEFHGSGAGSGSAAIGPVVFPLLRIDPSVPVAQLIGTGFLLGGHAIGVTAAHVLPADTTNVFAWRVVGGESKAQPLDCVERHPSVDLAVFRLPSIDADESPLEFRDAKVVGGTAYVQWGYPVDAAYREPSAGTVPSRVSPEPVFVRGYVRRRYDHELPLAEVPGTQFLELSELAGRGASGSPVMSEQDARRQRWHVLGVYVGENLSLDVDRPPVSYALRCDAFSGWRPQACEGPLV